MKRGNALIIFPVLFLQEDIIFRITIMLSWIGKCYWRLRQGVVFAERNISGWKGGYYLQSERKYLDFLYPMGLGSKNAQLVKLISNIIKTCRKSSELMISGMNFIPQRPPAHKPQYPWRPCSTCPRRSYRHIPVSGRRRLHRPCTMAHLCAKARWSPPWREPW